MNFAPINKTKHRLFSLSLTRQFGLRLANGQLLSKLQLKPINCHSSGFSTSSHMTKKQYTSTILVSLPEEMPFFYYDL